MNAIPRYSPLARLLSMVLSVALLLVGSPLTAAATLPDVVYVGNGSEVYQIDLRGLMSQAHDFTSAPVTFTISMKRAVLPESRLHPSFVFSEDPSPRDVTYLGSSEADVLAAAGVDLGRATWEDWIHSSLSVSSDTIVSRSRAGLDTFTMTVPTVILQKPAASLSSEVHVTIDVNGTRVAMAPAEFHEYVSHARTSGRLPTNYEFGPAVPEIAAAFHDLDRFANRAQGLEFATAALRDYEITPDGLECCVAPCGACVGALMGKLATAISLIVACGASVASGGLGALACVGAFVANQAANVALMIGCDACVGCVSNPPECCPCAGEPTCGCD